MTRVVYDAGALVAAERGDRATWALHRRALERGVRPTLPAPALAQVWRDGRQAQLARFLRGCRVAPLGETEARRAGATLAASGTCDVVDAAVAVAAGAGPGVIVTSDPEDLRALLDANGARATLHVV